LIIFVVIVGVVLFVLSPPVGAAAVAASVAAGVLLYRRDKRRLEELLNVVECDGRLKRPLLAVPGYIYSYYYAAGRNSTVVRHFELGGPAGRLEALDWGHAPRYLAAAGRNWLLLWLPAYEILDDCCRGYYVAAVKPSLTAERGPATLVLTTEEGDYARATVQVKAGIAEAVLEFWPVKARSARVELVADLGPHKTKLKLAESHGGPSTGAVAVAGRPGIYIIKGAVPPSEAETLGIEPGQIWGLGRGDYKARLVIDRPWKFDAAVETPLL
jgi:hypothetical protein